MPIPPFPQQPDPGEDDQGFPEEAPEHSLADDQPIADNLVTEEQAAAPADPGTTLPAEAQDETNGGPLGCCLGVTVGIMLCLLVAIIGVGPAVANVIVFLIHTDAITNTRIVTAFFALIGACVGGYFGWKIGKRLYREYEPPVIKDRGRKTKVQPGEAKT